MLNTIKDFAEILIMSITNFVFYCVEHNFKTEILIIKNNKQRNCCSTAIKDKAEILIIKYNKQRNCVQQQ